MTVFASFALIVSAAVSGSTPAPPIMADEMPRPQAAAPVPVEELTIPPVDQLSEPDGPIAQITFTTDEDGLQTIRDVAAAHEAACRELGRSQCQVLSFQQVTSYRQNGQMQLRLVRGLKASFVERLMETRNGLSFNAAPQNPGYRGRQSDASLEVSRSLIEAQLAAARALQVRGDEQVRQEAGRRVRRLENELEKVEVDIEMASIEEAFETLDITYRAQPEYSSGSWSRASRQTDELLAMFFLFALGAVALAILSSIYFGIIGFFLLKFRNLAIRLGLLKGTLPEPKAKDPEVITPSSKSAAAE